MRDTSEAPGMLWCLACCAGAAPVGEFQAHTLQILVADVPGVLQQVSERERECVGVRSEGGREGPGKGSSSLWAVHA